MKKIYTAAWVLLFLAAFFACNGNDKLGGLVIYSLSAGSRLRAGTVDGFENNPRTQDRLGNNGFLVKKEQKDVDKNLYRDLVFTWAVVLTVYFIG